MLTLAIPPTTGSSETVLAKRQAPLEKALPLLPRKQLAYEPADIKLLRTKKLIQNTQNGWHKRALLLQEESALALQIFDFYQRIAVKTKELLATLKSFALSIWEKSFRLFSEGHSGLKSRLVFALGKTYRGYISKPMYDLMERQALFSPLKAAPLKRLHPTLRNAIKRTRFFSVPELNGIELAAWHLPAKPGQPTILFNHGRNSNISYLSSLYYTFQKLGYGCFAYDYPGFGKSEGESSIETVHHAALAAQEELMALGVPAKQQIIMGHSLGGAIATDLAYRLIRDNLPENRRPKALILINTLSRPKDMLHSQAQEYRLYFDWIFRRSPDLLKRFPEIEAFFNLEHKIAELSKSGLPTLVLHSDKDAVFTESMGQKLHEAAKKEASKDTIALYQRLEGGHHLRRSLCEQLPPILEHFVRKL
jgi:alpha-beta hydrolase superfamily lysophospholipase